MDISETEWNDRNATGHIEKLLEISGVFKYGILPRLNGIEL